MGSLYILITWPIQTIFNVPLHSLSLLSMFVSRDCTLLGQWSTNEKKQHVGREAFCKARCLVDSKDIKQTGREWTLHWSITGHKWKYPHRRLRNGSSKEFLPLQTTWKSIIICQLPLQRLAANKDISPIIGLKFRASLPRITTSHIPAPEQNSYHYQ